MVIFTPATTPPCESVTVPAIRPKMLWAAAVSTTQAVNSTANINAAVFNAMLRNAPFQTTWFDLDTFVLTGTPPSKKWTLRLLLFPSGQRPSLFPPRFSLAIRGKSQKISDTTPRVLHCEMASHSHSGSEKSPTFAGRRQQILLPRCSAPNFERRTFVPQFLG